MDTKKNIAIVTLSFDGGGAEKILLRIVKNLANELNFHIITFYDKGIYLDEIKTLSHVKYTCIHAEKGNTLSFAWRIRKVFASTRPDRVLSFLYYPNIVTFLALSGSGILHFPSERSNHQKYLTKSFKHKIWKWLLKRTYNKAFKIITVSENSKKLIQEDFNVLPTKLINIYNGISFPMLDTLKAEPISDFRFDQDTKYIISVGNLYPVKNYPLLIESFDLVHSKFPNTRLLIIGKGDQEKVLRDIVLSKNLTNSVFLLGFMKNPHAFVSKASCYVLSSNFEGFPNSLLEAMYVNGHVISTDCPTGPSEIISTMKDGILCPLTNSQALADAMEKMCFDENFREFVYINSRKKIIQFDETIMISNYLNLLNQ